MIIKNFYWLNFLYKYGYEKRIKKDRGCLDNEKNKELNVKWSIRILNSVDRSINTKDNNKTK